MCSTGEVQCGVPADYRSHDGPTTVRSRQSRPHRMMTNLACLRARKSDFHRTVFLCMHSCNEWIATQSPAGLRALDSLGMCPHSCKAAPLAMGPHAWQHIPCTLCLVLISIADLRLSSSWCVGYKTTVEHALQYMLCTGTRHADGSTGFRTGSAWVFEPKATGRW